LHRWRRGIRIQLGYGIHRYATDRIWKVPHFEKMLYDQAQLAIASTECFRVSGQEKYRRMTKELFEYACRNRVCQLPTNSLQEMLAQLRLLPPPEE